jgi:hypothetical protein
MMKPKTRRRIWLGFDRALAHDLLRQLAILAVVLLVALGISYLMLSWSGAEWKEFCEAEHLSKYLLPLYLLTDSNALNNLYMGSDGTHVHGWMLLASSITFLFGAFIFNGVIIGIITNSIERRVKSHQEGRIHYLKSGHYIIMGYDDMVPSMISYIFKKAPGKLFLFLIICFGAIDASCPLRASLSAKAHSKMSLAAFNRRNTHSIAKPCFPSGQLSDIIWFKIHLLC